MFFGVSDFNQNLCSWNISSDIQKERMFEGTNCPYPSGVPPDYACYKCKCGCKEEAFYSLTDSNLQDEVDDYLDNDSGATEVPMKCWYMVHVTDFSNLFRDSDFNEPISCWDEWDTSSVTNMYVSTYCKSYSFTSTFHKEANIQILRSLSNQGMFYNARNFNDDLSTWDTSSVETMQVRQ